jgi:hypothetical protein
MAEIPAWLTRESVQLTLIVLITFGFHYYFISQRLQDNADDAVAQMEAEEAGM